MSVTRPSLASLEGGLALLYRRTQTLTMILGVAANLHGATLVAQRILEGELGVLADQLLGQANRDRWARGETIGPLKRRRHQLFGRDQRVDQPNSVGFLRVDDPTGIDQLGCSRRTDQARKQERATGIGREADADVDLAEARRG